MTFGPHYSMDFYDFLIITVEWVRLSTCQPQNLIFKVVYLGIAVSGGMDSMALAHLCASLPNLLEGHKGISRPDFHAFVVDHRARPGSGEEADSVAWRLRKLGIISDRDL